MRPKHSRDLYHHHLASPGPRSVTVLTDQLQWKQSSEQNTTMNGTQFQLYDIIQRFQAGNSHWLQVLRIDIIGWCFYANYLVFANWFADKRLGDYTEDVLKKYLLKFPKCRVLLWNMKHIEHCVTNVAWRQYFKFCENCFSKLMESQGKSKFYKLCFKLEEIIQVKRLLGYCDIRIFTIDFSCLFFYFSFHSAHHHQPGPEHQWIQ